MINELLLILKLGKVKKMVKIHVSGLTPKSQHLLSKKMTLEELKYMITLHSDVVKGIMTIEQYREKEKEFIIKYGFKVK